MPKAQSPNCFLSPGIDPTLISSTCLNTGVVRMWALHSRLLALIWVLHPIPRSSKRATNWRKRMPWFVWRNWTSTCRMCGRLCSLQLSKQRSISSPQLPQFRCSLQLRSSRLGAQAACAAPRTPDSLSQANENLARLTDEVELAVQTVIQQAGKDRANAEGIRGIAGLAHRIRRSA